MNDLNLDGKEKRKNVIFITTDALRPDVVVKLPFLGKLVEKSSFFSNVTSYQPNSTGAFYSIFTGIYGLRSGVDSYFGSLNFKKDKVKTLAQYFKDRDYFTIGHSMSDIILPNEGFDKYYTELDENKIPELYDTMIKEALDCGKNFFLHFHVAIIHSRVVENIAKKFKYDDKTYYERVDKNKEEYFKYALEADARVKGILDRFNLNECLLIICSDHGTTYGEKFGERFYGSMCYEDTLKTFAMFYGKNFPSFKYDKVVRGIDIMPTILENLNINRDVNFMDFDGRSLIPIINGDMVERIAFSETSPLPGASDYPSPKEPNIHAVRTDKWKLIFNKSSCKYEFYNLKNDPKENKDLFGQGLKEEKEMIEVLEQYLRVR